MVPSGVVGAGIDVGALVITLLGGLYAAAVVVFAVIWLAVNAYQYYPILRSAIGSLAARLGTPSRAAGSDPVGDGGNPPIIDLLLPAYDEATVIEQAIRSVEAASYPEDRLRLHVLIEPDDDATHQKLWSLAADYSFTIHQIPARYPGTPNKPRALNYGFSQTDAPLVGVIDAEDIVEPGLFREVAETFRNARSDFALGHLDMANEDDGWLNVLFRAEYGFWYNLVVPGFTRSGFPIPLGGTTCFFRRTVLEATAQVRKRRFGWPWGIGDRLWLADHGLLEPVPWNPDNVTEDFELGLLLWELGYDFRYLDAVTTEESPVSLDGWLDQRIRWQKGKLMTFASYLRHPPSGGWRKAHLLWQSALPHVGPINVLGVGLVFWLAVVVGVVPGRTLRILLAAGLFFVGATTLLFVTGYWSASTRPVGTRVRRAIIVGLTVPFYWLLQWLADVHALLDLRNGRISWTASEHLGRHFETATISAAAYVLRPDTRPALKRRLALLALGGIVFIAAVARSVFLDRWSLWHDEIYTIRIRGGASFGELLTMTTDPHPPFYYAIVHAWMAAFGTTPSAVRALSILFSLGTVIGVFLLGRSVFDDRTGLVAALMVAVSTTHIHFGRTVRMYSLFSLLATLSWFLYVGLRNDGRCFLWLPRSWRLRGGCYVAVTTALLYTHVYGVFVLASQHLVQLLSGEGRVSRRIWWALQVFTALLFAPWAVVIARQFFEITSAGGRSPIAWIPPPSMGLFRETVLLFGGYPSIYPIQAESIGALAATTVTLFVLTIAILLSVVTYDLGPQPTYYLVGGREAGMLGLFATSLFIPFGLSYLLQPVFVPRYAIVASIPLFVLAARGIVNVPELPWRGLLLTAFVLGSVATTGAYYSSDTSADWRGIADHLESEAESGDLVVFQPTWVAEDVLFYVPGLRADRHALRPDDALTEGDLDRLRELASGRETVWLVQHEAVNANRPREALRETSQVVEVIDGGVVVLYRFESEPSRAEIGIQAT